MLKEGRGQGISSKYKPWIRIQDVPSLGRVTRLKGIKTGRQHEFLSDMERNYFYFLEFADSVIDIREQFPLLPLEDTLLIAEELGIEHPKHPETGEFIIMTTDFLITTKENNKNVEMARTIKCKDELLNKRVLEKFEIERNYWKRKGVNWGIVTENEIDKDIANNLSFIHSYNDIRNIDSFVNINSNDLKDLIYEFIKRIFDDSKTIRAICSQFDKDIDLDNGSGVSIFKYLICNKIIEIDMTKKLDINTRVHIVKVKEELFSKVEAI